MSQYNENNLNEKNFLKVKDAILHSVPKFKQTVDDLQVIAQYPHLSTSETRRRIAIEIELAFEKMLSIELYTSNLIRHMREEEKKEEEEEEREEMLKEKDKMVKLQLAQLAYIESTREKALKQLNEDMKSTKNKIRIFQEILERLHYDLIKLCLIQAETYKSLGKSVKDLFDSVSNMSQPPIVNIDKLGIDVSLKDVVNKLATTIPEKIANMEIKASSFMQKINDEIKELIEERFCLKNNIKSHQDISEEHRSIIDDATTTIKLNLHNLFQQVNPNEYAEVINNAQKAFEADQNIKILEAKINHYKDELDSNIDKLNSLQAPSHDSVPRDDGAAISHRPVVESESKHSYSPKLFDSANKPEEVENDQNDEDLLSQFDEDDSFYNNEISENEDENPSKRGPGI